MISRASCFSMLDGSHGPCPGASLPSSAIMATWPLMGLDLDWSRMLAMDQCVSGTPSMDTIGSTHLWCLFAASFCPSLTFSTPCSLRGDQVGSRNIRAILQLQWDGSCLSMALLSALLSDAPQDVCYRFMGNCFMAYTAAIGLWCFIERPIMTFTSAGLKSVPKTPSSPHVPPETAPWRREALTRRLEGERWERALRPLEA